MTTLLSDPFANEFTTVERMLLLRVLGVAHFATAITDLSRPSARAQLEVLVAGRILQPAEGEALLALSRRTRHPSWAEAHGVAVDARAVGLARGGR